jgi:hypothetical protein
MTMFRRILASGLVLATIAGASLAATGTAQAEYGRNGAFVGGAAAGLVGGMLLGGAIANQNRYYDEGPVYYDEPQPVYVQPRCYLRRERVPNEYDPGWHVETVRVCR